MYTYYEVHVNYIGSINLYFHILSYNLAYILFKIKKYICLILEKK